MAWHTNGSGVFRSRVLRWAFLLASMGVAYSAMGQVDGDAADAPGVDIQTVEAGGFLCTTANYEARIGADGGLLSLQAGGTELLAPASGSQSAVGFVRDGMMVPLRTVSKTAADTLVAEGEPRDPATAVAASPCPMDARVTYHFLDDRVELLLEQSIETRARFAWVPSPSVTASRDALTDYPHVPGTPALYGQTDPRWNTEEGPVLRFDFGSWQRGFANANWGTVKVGEEAVACLTSTVYATRPATATIYPMARPGAGDALTFDISAASPDFLMPGAEPLHFDITVTNASRGPVEASVRFEVRYYLTRESVAGQSTELELDGKGQAPLPTDLALDEPGPYRATIIVGDANEPLRSFEWVFTYDFAGYEPATTREEDFEQFWQEALAESAATPLDIKMQAVPEKSTATTDAFRISFATLGGRRIYGWYSRPKAEGQYPVQVRFPSSGIYSIAGPEARADKCTLWIQIHGFDVDLSNMPEGDDPGKNYWTAGIESPQTSMWRTIYISLVSVDFMLEQPEADPDLVAVLGGSQGGGLAMVAAALDPRIGLAMPSHSGLPRLDWTVKYGPGYWPFGMDKKPEGQTEEQFLRTLSYFDPANFTQDIQCPIVAEIGMMDTVTASGNQVCALAHVPNGLLYLICSPWAGHGAGHRDPTLGRDCYTRFVSGEAPITDPTRP